MRRFLLLSLAIILTGCASGPGVHSAASTHSVALLEGTYIAKLQTSLGEIQIELYADKAPKAVTNFVELARSGFYDGLTFHRAIDGFVIQGGDPSGDGTGGASIFGQPFEDEQNDLGMTRGAVAMANKGRNSNLSQFFIVQRKGGAPWLQEKHTIFGKVTNGMDIVDAIAKVPTDERDKPLEPIIFNVDM